MTRSYFKAGDEVKILDVGNTWWDKNVIGSIGTVIEVDDFFPILKVKINNELPIEWIGHYYTIRVDRIRNNPKQLQIGDKVVIMDFIEEDFQLDATITEYIDDVDMYKVVDSDGNSHIRIAQYIKTVE